MGERARQDRRLKGQRNGSSSGLCCVELNETKNEVLSGANYKIAYRGGFDSGWPSTVPEYTYNWVEPSIGGSVWLVWLEHITQKIRSLAPGIPITTSEPSGQFLPDNDSNNGRDGLGVYYEASHGKKWAPDFYALHVYSGTDASYALTEMRTALSTTGGDKSLWIGETNVDYEGNGGAESGRSGGSS
jgi:hypothetical protein